jgi:hypothetical protein
MKWGSQEGIVLVITLLVMTILLIMGSAFLSISSTETLIAINERNRLQAFHLAEAGLERTIAELNVNGTYPGALREQSLGPGTYEAVVTDLGSIPGIVDPRKIISTGYVPNSAVSKRAMAQLEVVVRRRSPFRFALFGLNLVELRDRVALDSYDSAKAAYDPSTAGMEGHIHSNGDVTLLANDTVKGNAQAGVSVTFGSLSTIVGSVVQGVPREHVAMELDYPTPTNNVAGISPPSAYNSSTHDLTVGPGEMVMLDPGNYGFNRITLGPGAQLAMIGPVIIYMTGNLYAQKGAVINTSKIPTNLLVFSSMSGIDTVLMDEGPGEFYGGIYAIAGEVDFQKGGWVIFGAIIADRIDIGDDARFHYDLAFARSSTAVGKFVPVVGTWRELFSSAY